MTERYIGQVIKISNKQNVDIRVFLEDEIQAVKYIGLSVHKCRYCISGEGEVGGCTWHARLAM